jgi:DNA-binding NarL/FixJ family response regulator
VIRVCVVEDHARVRAGIEALVNTMGDAGVVASAGDGREGVRAVEHHRPDVVLMDLAMPVLDGIDATRAIAGRVPGARVVVHTALRDRTRVRAALGAGAVGVVLKDAEPCELFRAIRAAAGS